MIRGFKAPATSTASLRDETFSIAILRWS